MSRRAERPPTARPGRATTSARTRGSRPRPWQRPGRRPPRSGSARARCRYSAAWASPGTATLTCTYARRLSARTRSLPRRPRLMSWRTSPCSRRRVRDMTDTAGPRSSPRWREPAQLYAIARSIRGDAGPATQRRIKDARHRIAKRVKRTDWARLGVAEEAGVSPATFYRYYRDVEHVAQALCMDVIHDLDRAAEFAESDWLGSRGEEAALAFVEEFLAHWRRNKAILRMRNLKAEEGDSFFEDLRVHMLRRSTTALVRRMRGPGVPWGAPAPSVAATRLVGRLERAGAYQDVYRGGAQTVARVAASLIYEAVTSRSPAAAASLESGRRPARRRGAPVRGRTVLRHGGRPEGASPGCPRSDLDRISRFPWPHLRDVQPAGRRPGPPRSGG